MPAVSSKSIASLIDEKVLKQLSFGTALSVGLNVAFAAGDYRDAREEGQGHVGAVTKAVAGAVMNDVVGMPAYLAAGLISQAPKLAISAYEGAGKMTRSMSRSSTNKPFMNATFVDNNQAFTMRQAGMQLAKASKYNLQQSMLGQEAQYLRY